MRKYLHPAAVVALAASLFTAGVLYQPASHEAKAEAPKVVPWIANFSWGWVRHQGPSAAMTATFAQGARVKLTCTSWMTKGGLVQGLGPTRDGINYVHCPVVGRWAGKGRYTAHYGFSGTITAPGFVWLPPLPSSEPSCQVQGGRKVLVCDDIRRSKVYTRRGG